MADFLLSDVEIVAVSICKGPANRRRIYLKKHEGTEPLITSPSRHNVICKAEGDGGWRVFYSVVAEPGWEEQPGVGEGAQAGTTDMWRDEDEIRKASHSFMRSGGLINLQHKDLNPVGRVVENFIAPDNFSITMPNGETEEIKKGAWVIGIEPNDDLRNLIDSGELDGVSYEGMGVRTPVEKELDKPQTHRKCKKCGAKMARDHSKCKSCGAGYVAKVSSRAYPSLERVPGKQNWVDHAGGLPSFIERIAKHLHYEQGMSIGRAIATAVSRCRAWAAGGDNVKPDTQAKAARAIAQWEAKKARSNAKNVKKSVVSEESPMSLLAKIAEKLGIETDAVELTPEEKALLEGASIEEEEVPLTDEQQAALAKVAGIEAQVTDLVKDDGRLATIESNLATLLERIPAPEQQKTEEEKRAELEATVGDLATSLQKAQADLAELAQGTSQQGSGADQDLKKNDPEAALAHALVS